MPAPIRSIPALLAALALVACGRHDPNAATAAAPEAALPQRANPAAACSELPSEADLKNWMKQAAAQGSVGGMAEGRAEWAAVVDRNGLLCAIAVETDDPAAAWPGSQSIAKAKAFTANAFSSDTVAMSTARLYTLGQPGHSLWGIANGVPFNPKCLSAPNAPGGKGEFCGGVIAFGGGVPLYKNASRVGGLGLSGDTACADHEMAKRVRTLAKLDPSQGPDVDDITYSVSDGATIYTHPLCPNTYRNGKKIGDEPAATGY